MSEIKHTPGPWIWGANLKGLYGAGPDNAVLDYEFCENMWLHGERAPANARLIAAAPDLLALLIELTDIEGPQPGNSEWGTKVRVAIDTARGAA